MLGSKNEHHVTTQELQEHLNDALSLYEKSYLHHDKSGWYCQISTHTHCCLSVCLPVYLSILSIYLSIYLSAYQLSFFLSFPKHRMCMERKPKTGSPHDDTVISS